MAPPRKNSNAHGSLPKPWYKDDIQVDAAHASHSQQQGKNNHKPGQRHDSPIESRRSVPQLLELNSEHNHTSPEVACQPINGQDAHQHTTNMATMHRPRQATITPTPSGPNTDDEEPNLFVIVENPTAPQDRNRMRNIRQHVMYDFLRKERRKTSGPRDPRVETPTLTGVKRKRAEAGPVSTPGGPSMDVSANPLHPSNLFHPGFELTPASSIRSAASSLYGSESETSLVASNESPSKAQPAESQWWQQPEQAISSGIQAMTPHRPSASPPRSENLITQAPSEQPLMLPWRYKVENTNYYAVEPDTVPFAFPFPSTDLGTGLNPFETWPKFDDPTVNVRALKHHCGIHFGSRGLLEIWVPVLLRARHTFLSTVCIATAHRDAMRGIHGSTDRVSEEVEHRRAHQEVFRMIIRVIEKETSEHGVVSDETIAAELQLLMSAIMSEAHDVVCMHEWVLTRMVCQRGGLENTRKDQLRERHLPAILTVTLYVVAVLHEKLPHETYMRWANQQGAEPSRTGEGKPFPESPVFCGDSYVAVRRAVSEDGQMIQLLNLLRDMTKIFNMNPSISRNDGLARCKRRIDAFEAGQQDQFATEEARRYEVVRLVARVYVYALANGVSFSQASQVLGVKHEDIVQALSRTSLTECWGAMAGVLFWTTLVAAAAANSSTPTNVRHITRSPVESTEAEASRKYLSTIAIRCSIVLGFEHGPVVLQTLKNILGIQQALATRIFTLQEPASNVSQKTPGSIASSAQSATANPGRVVSHTRIPQQQRHQRPKNQRDAVLRQNGNGAHLTVPTPQQRRFYGPPRPVYQQQQQQQQRGFIDFSRDFSDVMYDIDGGS